MKALLFVIVCFYLSTLWAAEYPRSMIQITTTGLGVKGLYEKFSSRENAVFDDFDLRNGSWAINYTYTFAPHYQLGVFISRIHELRKFKTSQGESGKIERTNFFIGLMGLYNFSQELKNSYYVGGMISAFNREDENSHTEPFNYLEDDRSGQSLDIIWGKRFAIPVQGLSNLSFSPSLSVFKTHSQKDYKDDGIDRSYGVIVNVIKFDIFF